MDRGTYVAASGGLLALRKLEIVNNNLANSNTPGFKGQYMVNQTRQFDETLAQSLSEGDPYASYDHERMPDVRSVKTVTDFTAGAVKGTGNPLDVALRDSNDFFVINTGEGMRYSRAGNFTLDSEGRLVTNDGQPVQGNGGAIQINEGAASISASGAVFAGQEEVGRLQIVRIEEPDNLIRVGANRFKLATGQRPPVPQDNPDVITQSLEMSNVSTIKSMIELIAANRGFEMYTKTARSIDEMNQTAITQVGRSR